MQNCPWHFTTRLICERMYRICKYSWFDLGCKWKKDPATQYRAIGPWLICGHQQWISSISPATLSDVTFSVCQIFTPYSTLSPFAYITPLRWRSQYPFRNPFGRPLCLGAVRRLFRFSSFAIIPPSWPFNFHWAEGTLRWVARQGVRILP